MSPLIRVVPTATQAFRKTGTNAVSVTLKGVLRTAKAFHFAASDDTGTSSRHGRTSPRIGIRCYCGGVLRIRKFVSRQSGESVESRSSTDEPSEVTAQSAVESNATSHVTSADAAHDPVRVVPGDEFSPVRRPDPEAGYSKRYVKTLRSDKVKRGHRRKRESDGVIERDVVKEAKIAAKAAALAAYQAKQANKAPRFLIASVGKLPPHHLSRQSAGHYLLQQLATRYDLSVATKLPHGTMELSHDRGPPEYTLWQCDTGPAESGDAFRQAWEAHKRKHGDQTWKALVILHYQTDLPFGHVHLNRAMDELETSGPGLDVIRNRMKQANHLEQLGDRRLMRVSIGIGPAGTNEASDTKDYLEEDMSAEEKTLLDRKADVVYGWLELEKKSLPASKRKAKTLWRHTRIATLLEEDFVRHYRKGDRHEKKMLI